MQPKVQKPGSIFEIVTLLVLVGLSIWLPKQESFFRKDSIAQGQEQSASFLSAIGATTLLLTSDKVVLPESWSADVSVADELRVLKLRSKQVRFVQNVSESESVSVLHSLRGPAATSLEAESSPWLIDSVTRVSASGEKETLSVADIDGERTTPFVELSKGANEFSVVYRHQADRGRLLQKRLRLVNGT